MKKKVFAICGSTRKQSANLQLLQLISVLAADKIDLDIYTQLDQLPQFNPDLDREDALVPETIGSLRANIARADGVLICTPEYVFSLPGSLKNAIDWTVSTTLFSEKPVALITASASGAKAHEQLQLILKTIYADLRPCAQLLISGIKGKFNQEGMITDTRTLQEIDQLIVCFYEQMNQKQ